MNRAIIDIETGGFSKSKNGIVQIGLIVFDENYNIIDEYNSLIIPYYNATGDALMEYTQGAEEIHGHSVEKMHREGNHATYVCREIDEIINSYQIIQFVGHNINKFDLPWLELFWSRFSAQGSEGRFPETLDTLTNAKQLLNASSFSLESLCAGLGISHDNAHDALGDCQATLELLKVLES